MGEEKALSIFLCPVCRNPLIQDEKRYFCSYGHSFDIASAGYVHLLPANQKNSLLPGDDKNMAAARNRFLNGGWYCALRDAIASCVTSYLPPNGFFFDSGCGEGYYTAGVMEALHKRGDHAKVAGIDISKFSLRWAAKRNREIPFAVASAYHLPVPDKSVDFLLNCFSPLAQDEFRRILKPGGYFLYVVPAPRHLWELKEAIYDHPYENKEQRISYQGFQYVSVNRVEKRIVLSDSQSIQDLFGMTPYAWKTSPDGIQRMKSLKSLEVQTAFDLHLFQRA